MNNKPTVYSCLKCGFWTTDENAEHEHGLKPSNTPPQSKPDTKTVTATKDNELRFDPPLDLKAGRTYEMKITDVTEPKPDTRPKSKCCGVMIIKYGYNKYSCGYCGEEAEAPKPETEPSCDGCQKPIVWDEDTQVSVGDKHYHWGCEPAPKNQEPEKSPFITLDGESLIQCGSCGEIRKVKETHTCPPKNQDTQSLQITEDMIKRAVRASNEDQRRLVEKANQDTQPEGMEDSKKTLALEWLAKHTNSYVGDTEDLSNVCLDGWFDLEELLAAAEKRMAERIIEDVSESTDHPDIDGYCNYLREKYLTPREDK